MEPETPLPVNPTEQEMLSDTLPDFFFRCPDSDGNGYPVIVWWRSAAVLPASGFSRLKSQNSVDFLNVDPEPDVDRLEYSPVDDPPLRYKNSNSFVHLGSGNDISDALLP